MDKRKFLLQIIRGQYPKRRYIKLYEYQGDKQVFLGQQEISLSEDIEIEVVTSKGQVVDETDF
ncbi:hypothetical protein [uncultured Parabacteroides sp.]|jgi:hypothetical protein|uniref:hypothetical protein n=1 Tax=uncultured Parabacteroides sp. TaxID=512312 RepID=UPI0025F04B3C|nr:hypothetical protein [uncultured Parabacteroides sp.]